MRWAQSRRYAPLTKKVKCAYARRATERQYVHMRSPPEPSNETTMNWGGRSGGGFGFGRAVRLRTAGASCLEGSFGTAARASPAAQAASVTTTSQRIAAILRGVASGRVQRRFRRVKRARALYSSGPCQS